MQRYQDEHNRRVVLVGTHRNPGQSEQKITDEDFDFINTILVEKIVKDGRCVNHVRRISGRCFISVENSLCDPIESGADELRRILTEIKGQQKFLDEVYPLSWLRFEGRLLEMKKDMSQIKCLPKEELREIAKSSGVSVPEDDVLEFFHDTGNIILLSRVSKLFLSDEEADRISRLVIIDPKWLIRVMQVVVELPENCTQITGQQQLDLESGIITLQVLEKLWSDQKKVPEKSLIKVEMLCIILQAFCLIHRQPQFDSEDRVDRIESQSYVIPSLLPEATDPQKIGQMNLSWINFYFDFEKFLPLEVYHRLVCMFIAQTRKNEYELSSSLCRFDMVQGCKWKIELEAYQHRIKISVIIFSELKPCDCITLIHEKYLKRICKESELQGLKYHGGPLLPCKCQESVFTFVSFDISEDSDKNPKVLQCYCCGEKSSNKNSISDAVNNCLQLTDKDSIDGCVYSAIKPLTIDELMKWKGLQESDLDQEIQKKDILKLASCFDSVDSYLDSFGLSPADERDVNNKKFDSTRDAISKALKLWREPNPRNATYRALLEIVLQQEKGDVAGCIAECIKKTV